MNEPKPFASLGPSLLARKGAARPAMRPQLQPMQQFHEATARQLEDDLGWNDMGDDVPESAHPAPVAEPLPVVRRAIAPVASLAPVAEVVSIHADAAHADAVQVKRVVPEVVRQQEAVAVRVAAAAVAAVPVAAPVVAEPLRAPARPVAAAPRSRRSALEDGRRAAFTLRLDAERHLKLRLACTVAGRSAQQFVTDALDQLIASLPEIDSLAAQVRKRK